MTQVPNHVWIYLALHAIFTIGAIVGSWIRMERRITRVETILELCLPTLKKTNE